MPCARVFLIFFWRSFGELFIIKAGLGLVSKILFYLVLFLWIKEFCKRLNIQWAFRYWFLFQRWGGRSKPIMTLSGFLKVLTKLLEPSLSFQLFGASTPEGRFSKDRQFTFFPQPIQLYKFIFGHFYVSFGFSQKSCFFFLECEVKTKVLARPNGNTCLSTAYHGHFLLYRKCTLVMVIGWLCH